MSTPTPTNGDAGRLNGWKEIAAHLGKGPRTVQRWEKVYGLPVHRIGREGGEIVFAFRDEIDRWSRRAANEALRETDDPSVTGTPGTTAPPASTARGRLSRTQWVAVAATGGLALAVAWWLALTRPAASSVSTAGAPAAWRLVDGKLTVFDEAGRLVFTRDLGFPTSSPLSSADVQRPHSAAVRIADIDGDGSAEVLVSAPAVRREGRRFYCFEADGRPRFVDAPKGVMRFGDTDYGEPWLAHAHFVTGPRERSSLFVAFTHNLWFPTRVRRLDARGGLASEYWSNGFVEFVDEVAWAGRPTVLVGGAGNDVRGASLAVFEASRVTGHSPSATTTHACRGCPPGGPVARLTFPSLCIARQRNGIATVTDAWVEAGDRLAVQVTQGSADGDVFVFYTLGPDLSPVHAEISAEFRTLHAAMERKGLLDHAFGARDDTDMFPVQRFDPDGHVRRLPPVAVRH